MPTINLIIITYLTVWTVDITIWIVVRVDQKVIGSEKWRVLGYQKILWGVVVGDQLERYRNIRIEWESGKVGEIRIWAI